MSQTKAEQQAELEVQQLLIILKLAESLRDPSENELCDLALRSMYMDYFGFQHLFRRLLDEGFLTRSLRKGEIRLDSEGQAQLSIDLSDKGLHLLSTLQDQISLPVLKYLREILHESELRRRDEEGLIARYHPDDRGQYRVHLEYDDQRFEHFSLEFNVHREAKARALCHRWKQAAGDVYFEILKLLETKLDAPAPETAPPAREKTSATSAERNASGNPAEHTPPDAGRADARHTPRRENTDISR